MNTQLFAKTYLLGNEDARAYPDKSMYSLAEQRGYEAGTDEFACHVSGGAAFRLYGHTFDTSSENIQL